MIFTEMGSPRWIAYRETQHDGQHFHFCSDSCETIFSNEPDKYVQSRLPSHEILHAHRGDKLEDALRSSIAAMGVVIGQDNGSFDGSVDQKNFEEWGGGQDMKEAQL